jgi:hypothetical protein
MLIGDDGTLAQLDFDPLLAVDMSAKLVWAKPSASAMKSKPRILIGPSSYTFNIWLYPPRAYATSNDPLHSTGSLSTQPSVQLGRLSDTTPAAGSMQERGFNGHFCTQKAVCGKTEATVF